ncbi:hypothetical protein DFH09DRAFT_1078527 [Mycena vulgaris]|nr:hypothetical protein DFH09DRAFT_1078527 [Mycena vulgaris]
MSTGSADSGGSQTHICMQVRKQHSSVLMAGAYLRTSRGRLGPHLDPRCLLRVKERPATVDDLVDLHGKVVILNGGNTEIGYATIQILARKGAKAEGLNDGSVHSLQLDLSDPRAAHRSAKELLEKEQRLDILVNNAATVTRPFKLTPDGILNMMVINSRRTPTQGSTRRHSLQKEAFNKDYGTSFMRLNAEAVPITCISLHPGAIKSEASAGSWAPSRLSEDSSRRAMTVAFAAVGKEVAAQRTLHQTSGCRRNCTKIQKDTQPNSQIVS